MALNKPQLQPRQKIFTHQDFLDGKCTADGFALDKGAEVAPEQASTPSPEPIPEKATSQTTDEPTESPADVVKETPAGEVSGDSPDST